MESHRRNPGRRVAHFGHPPLHLRSLDVGVAPARSSLVRVPAIRAGTDDPQKRSKYRIALSCEETSINTDVQSDTTAVAREARHS